MNTDSIAATLAKFGYVDEPTAVRMTGLSAAQLHAARLYGLLDFPLDERGHPHKDDRGYLVSGGNTCVFPKWNVVELMKPYQIRAARYAATRIDPVVSRQRS